MDRYEELEKLYYRKKYKKIVFILFILLTIFSFFFLFVFNNSDTQNSKNQNNLSSKKIIQNKIENKDKEKNKNNKDNNEKVNLEKEISQQEILHKEKVEVKNKIPKVKIKKIKEVDKLVLYPIFPDILEKNKTKKAIIEKKVKIENKKEIVEKTLSKKETNLQIENKVEEKPQIQTQFKIVVKTKIDSVDDAINLYNQSPNYQTAMAITKIYFDKENYQKSIEWAKKANKFKPEDDESWYIFAKSLIKLGETKKAKEVLIAYLNNYGSSHKIEKLLRSLK